MKLAFDQASSKSLKDPKLEAEFSSKIGKATEESNGSKSMTSASSFSSTQSISKEAEYKFEEKVGVEPNIQGEKQQVSCKKIQEVETVQKVTKLGVDGDIKRSAKSENILLSLLKNSDLIVKYLISAENSREVGKFIYTLGLVITFATVYILSFSPGRFFLYWMTLIQILSFVKRFILFKELGRHFFMIDYCYYSNFTVLAFIWLFPGSQTLYYASFAQGSISMVILLVRNTIVYHDIDKLTGSALHFFPMLHMWNIHWNIRGTEARANWGFLEVENIEFSLSFVKEYYLSALTIYLLWAACYYTILFFSWNHILRNDYLCLLKQELQSGQFVKDFKKKYGRKIAMAVFATKHVTYASIMYLIFMVAFFSKYYCVTFLFYFAYELLKGGGEYYTKHFSKKYVLNAEDILADNLTKSSETKKNCFRHSK